MNVEQMIKALDLSVFTGSGVLGKEVKGAYVSDLLSDVMGFAQEGDVWITLQSHLNVVAIASLKEIPAIILVKNVIPDDIVINKAEQEGISLLGTHEATFNIAGKLFQLLNRR